MKYYAAERKKEFLPFVIAWLELESIMLSEIKLFNSKATQNMSKEKWDK